MNPKHLFCAFALFHSTAFGAQLAALNQLLGGSVVLENATITTIKADSVHVDGKDEKDNVPEESTSCLLSKRKDEEKTTVQKKDDETAVPKKAEERSSDHATIEVKPLVKDAAIKQASIEVDLAKTDAVKVIEDGKTAHDEITAAKKTIEKEAESHPHPDVKPAEKEPEAGKSSDAKTDSEKNTASGINSDDDKLHLNTPSASVDPHRDLLKTTPLEKDKDEASNKSITEIHNDEASKKLIPDIHQVTKNSIENDLTTPEGSKDNKAEVNGTAKTVLTAKSLKKNEKESATAKEESKDNPAASNHPSPSKPENETIVAKGGKDEKEKIARASSSKDEKEKVVAAPASKDEKEKIVAAPTNNASELPSINPKSSKDTSAHHSNEKSPSKVNENEAPTTDKVAVASIEKQSSPKELNSGNAKIYEHSSSASPSTKAKTADNDSSSISESPSTVEASKDKPPSDIKVVEATLQPLTVEKHI